MKIFKKKSVLDNESFLKIIVMSVLFAVYMLPQGLLEGKFNVTLPIDKLLFTAMMILAFFLIKVTSGKITKSQIILIIAMVLASILCQDIRCMMFIYLPVIEDLIPYRKKIIEILKKSKVLYVCLGFTLLYTVIYMWLGIVNEDRFAFSAIAEINQSGLAIFCLSLLLMLKNKRLGYLCMAFGLFTVSRSYYLAVGLYLIAKMKVVRKLMARIKRWKLVSYPALVAVSSILLLLIGWFFIYQNSMGNVYWGDDVESRVFNLLDYSNLFRFATNIGLVMIFIRSPYRLFTGLNDSVYYAELASSYAKLGIPFKPLYPHNLFFSHLRLYGLFSVVETWYIGRIMYKIVNSENLITFIAIVLYSIILGAGLYSYWLFLSFMTLCAEGDVVDKAEARR